MGLSYSGCSLLLHSRVMLSIPWHRRQMDWDIDCVVPVPDGARPTAIQISSVLGLPYREGLVKNRYVGRTFIMPDQVLASPHPATVQVRS